MSRIFPLSIKTAPLGRARKVPNSGASMRKPRSPNDMLLSINRGRYETILVGRAATPQFRGGVSEQKKDSGSARQGETANTKTCNRPNRLNLLIWTAGGAWRSNYLRIFRTRQVPLCQGFTTSSPLGSQPRLEQPRPLPPGAAT